MTNFSTPAVSIETHWTLDDLIAYLGTWSAVKRYAIEAPGPEAGALLDRAADRLAPLWGAGPRCVTMPIVLRVGRKRGA